MLDSKITNMTICSIFYLMMFMTTSVAFPYPRQAQPEVNQAPGEYCSLIAINKLLEAYQLPVIGQEVRDHMRYRDTREKTLNMDNGILRILMGKELTQLPSNEDTFETFPPISGTSRIDDLAEKRKQLQLQMNKIINDIASMQEECIKKIRAESDNFGNTDEITLFAPAQDAIKDQLILADTNVIDTDLVNSFPKRNSLALNPSGWRKRRSSVETEQERVQHFLRNMRQLLDKRQQRLNFNPTGW